MLPSEVQTDPELDSSATRHTLHIQSQLKQSWLPTFSGNQWIGPVMLTPILESQLMPPRSASTANTSGVCAFVQNR